jgi:hypothetical protein
MTDLPPDLKRRDARRATKVAALSEEAKQAARETGLDDERSVLLSTRECNRAYFCIFVLSPAEKH